MAIFRLIIPGALFRLCGGRVENLGDLQPLAVKAGLNGVMMGNFLTTLGAEPEDDRAMFEELGLNVARQPDNGANPRPDNRSGWLDGETPATPMDELVDHQDEANFWDPSTQLRVIKKAKKPPPYPDSRLLRSRAPHDRHRRAAGGAPRERAPPPAAPDRRAAGAAGHCSTGGPVLLLCSNNYLGLAEHPAVRAAAAEAAIALGRRRRRLAADLGQHGAAPRASSGAWRSSRATRRRSSSAPATSPTPARSRRSPAAARVVFSDELNHASIIDGCRLARAETFVYRHADVEHLAWGLREARGDAASLIVTDGVFSMDGDVAPLAALARLARDHGCRLMVDEAHATGALGPGGRGSVAAAGLSGEVDVVVGTLGKALGSYGAYACASAELVEYLLNSARPFIFSTAPPPPTVAAALAALELLEERARPGRAAARQRRRPARRAARPRASRRAARRARSSRSRSATPRRTMELSESLLARRRLRPGDPAADRSRRAPRDCASR